MGTPVIPRSLEAQLEAVQARLVEVAEGRAREERGQEEETSECKYRLEGCQFAVPSVRAHELHYCGFRATRCPSLTCTERPAAAALAEHIATEHDGSTRGRDVVVRTGGNQLISSYVNLDREPLFYKTTRSCRMSGLAEGRVFTVSI